MLANVQQLTKDQARFMMNVTFLDDEDGGCWIWTGNINGKCPGKFYLDGAYILARRAALVLFGQDKVERSRNNTTVFACQKSGLCVKSNHLTVLDTSDISARLLARSELVPGPLATPCRVWTGAAYESGYGRISSTKHNSHERVHVVAWEHANGPIPPGKCVMHKCDTRLCFAEDHLILGTQQDNVSDMDAKGRRRSVYGELHYKTKFTEDDIKKIRQDTHTLEVIGKEYNVSADCIHRIKTRKTWKHSA